MYTMLGILIYSCVRARERLNFFAASIRCVCMEWEIFFEKFPLYIIGDTVSICLRKQTHEISIIKQNRLEEKQKENVKKCLIEYWMPKIKWRRKKLRYNKLQKQTTEHTI